jgi:hypothetical protein
MKGIAGPHSRVLSEATLEGWIRDPVVVRVIFQVWRSPEIQDTTTISETLGEYFVVDQRKEISLSSDGAQMLYYR